MGQPDSLLNLKGVLPYYVAVEGASNGTARPSRRWRRTLLVVIMLALFAFLGYSCGLVVPPGPIQRLQTLRQEQRYEAYPKPDGMDRIGVERYTLTHDSFGPRAGQVRYLYSVPEGWTGREMIAWLRDASPAADLVVVDDAVCAELLASRPAPPPTPTSGDSDGSAGAVTSDSAVVGLSVVLEQETSLTLVRSIDHLGDGLTFRQTSTTQSRGASGSSLDFADWGTPR